MNYSHNNTRKDRQKEHEMIFGIHPISEALKKGVEIEKVFIQQGGGDPKSSEIKKQLVQLEIPFLYVPREKLDKLTRSNHQGLIAFLSPISFSPLEEIVNRSFEEGKNPFLLMLDRVTDVRNFGAICRTAECFGIDAVIVPARGSARIGGDAVKTSAGALMHLPICRSQNLKETIDYLKNSGIRLIGITEKSNDKLSSLPLDGPLCLILGSEEDGISPEYLKKCDLKAGIPMKGNTTSLNVSVAASIAMYEVVSQREN
jgi:23S rRNA (guanosine2251-2'-O)-methyltransferase